MIIFVLAYINSTSANELSWGDIRDGVITLYPKSNDTLNIAWRHAWISEANDEELYLLNNNGELVDKITIPRSSQSDNHNLILYDKDEAYQLIIPGYSFRNYTITHSENTISFFEPNKLHVSIEQNKDSKLYFTTPGASNASFSGKYYSGANQIKLERISDKRTLYLTLKQHENYSKYDSIQLPTSESDETWEVTFNKSGKISFWIDGSDNIFAKSIDNIHSKTAITDKVITKEANTKITLSGKTIGLSPYIGAALPYTEPAFENYQLLQSMNLKSTNYYSFVDSITRNPSREHGFRDIYANTFNISHSITLLAGSNRRAVLLFDDEARTGLSNWVNDTEYLHLTNNTNYIAFADEPNLNYRSYNDFSQYFNNMLSFLKNNHPNYKSFGIKVAIPASSRFLGGPFINASNQHIGIDWARRLLNEHNADIDAIAWHEWMIRNLYATRRYQDSIKAAASLVGLNNNGRPNKSLLLDQTNISSGNAVSPFEQETHYAGLWWASVIINSSQDGLLEMLNWFQLADDSGHHKGFISDSETGQPILKPVAHAHIFLTSKWLKNINEVKNSSFEIDVLHAQENDMQQLIGVNKSKRAHTLEIQLNEACPKNLTIRILDQNSKINQAQFTCHQNLINLKLPEQSIFKAEWNTAQ